MRVLLEFMSVLVGLVRLGLAVVWQRFGRSLGQPFGPAARHHATASLNARRGARGATSPPSGGVARSTCGTRLRIRANLAVFVTRADEGNGGPDEDQQGVAACEDCRRFRRTFGLQLAITVGL